MFLQLYIMKLFAIYLKQWANFCVSQTILSFHIQIMLSAVILNLFKHLVVRHPFLWILKTPICVNLHNLTDKEMYCPLLEVQKKLSQGLIQARYIFGDYCGQISLWSVAVYCWIFQIIPTSLVRSGCLALIILNV